MRDSQTRMVLKHLKAGRKIQPLQALQLYGTQRLAARITDLVDMGYDVQRRFIRVRKSDGSYTRVMQYWL